MLRAIAVLLAIAIAIVGAIEGVGYWSCKQLPEQQGEAAKAEEAYEKYCSTMGATFKFGSVEVGEFIHSYHDEINALSTVVIAIFTCILGIFTVSLSRSTRIAADAAALNAQAVMDAEGAHLYPIIKKSNLKDAFQSAILYPSMPDVDSLPAPFAEYVFKNYGKSPAFIESVMHGIRVYELSHKSRVISPGSESFLEIVVAGGNSREIQCDIFESFNRGKAKGILEHKSELLFFGEVFFRVFFNRRFQCYWEFNGRPDGFHLYKIEERPNPDAKS
jgi:hypothetical protein